MDGWIKLHRALIDKPIWLLSTPEQKTILITLLLMANHEEKEWEWKGEKYICKPGQIITSIESIRRFAGKNISTQNVRAALLRFEKLEFLTNESTMLSRLITICNWNSYQSDQQSIQQSDQQRANKEPTTNKNDKNIYNTSSNEEVCTEKKKKPSRKKKNDNSDSELNSQARKIFEARYLRETRESYYWSAKDAGSMSNVLRALKHQREEKGLSNEDNNDVLAALTMFINTALKDDWIKKNLSVSILYNKFNEIVARARKEEQERKQKKQKTEKIYGVK